MNQAEILEWQKKERAFMLTDIGKAFNKFKNTYSISLRSDYDDGLSFKTIKKWWDEATEAEIELKKLLGWGK